MNSIRPDSETVSEPFGSRRIARPGMTDGAGRCAGASVSELNLKLELELFFWPGVERGSAAG
jgi:hypothetical protein